MTAPTDTQKKRSIWSRLYHGETNIDFVGRWKLWFAISGVVILVGVAALAGRGLNLGIDFTGGTVWEVPAGKADVAKVEQAMGDLGYDDVQVQLITQNTGSGDKRIMRVEAAATATPAAATAPMTNCPSAPMFHTFERKHTAKPSAIKSRGVALSASSPRA